MMRLVTTIGALAVLALATVAAAGTEDPNTPVSTTPSKPAAKAPLVLRAGGLAVTWPLRGERAALAAGRRVVVRVRPISILADAPRPARIALLRLGRDGRPVDAVARARLRDGAFAVRIPDAAHYLLRVAIGDWRHQTTIRGTRSCMAVPARGRLAATLRLDRDSARPGETVSATLANTGAVCLTTGLAYGWERRAAGGAWEPVAPPVDLAFPDLALILAPATDQPQDVQVWDGMGPGTYRLFKDVNAQTRRPASRHVVSEPLVVPAP